MKNTLKSLLIASSFALPVLTYSAVAMPVKSVEMHQEQGSIQHKMKHKLKKMARFLDLSDDQKLQVKAIFAEAKENKMALKENRLAYKEQRKLLISAPTFDESAFVSLQQQYQAMFSEAALNKAKVQHAIYQVLTEEQRDKLNKAKGKRRGLFH